MAESLFLKLFDNSTEIPCPADPKQTFQDNSFCNSPTIEYLTRRTRQPIKHRNLVGFSQNESYSELPVRKKITAEQFPKRNQYKHCLSDRIPLSPLFPSVIKPQGSKLSTSTPLKPVNQSTMPKFSELLSMCGDQDVLSQNTPNRDESFKIMGPICSLFSSCDLNKFQMNGESPLTEGSTGMATRNIKAKRSLNLSIQGSQSDSPPCLKDPIKVLASPARAYIKTTLERVENNPDLIGDGTDSFCLPTIPGKHQDLKSVTPETLAKVINHEYDHIIEKFVIIDCRYPYEYQGGHIKGAENVYTKECLMRNFLTASLNSKTDRKRTVLIFHCEFSSERAPKLMRFLRHQDRDCNKDRYPFLFYPEVYLLHAGYKHFFHTHKELCTPQAYRPMHHECYKDELRKFRLESKAMSGDKKSRPLLKTRMGLQTGC